MAEYQYPAVLVEESHAQATAIPGVPTSTTELPLEAVTAALVSALRTHVPDWSSHDESDPGVTLLELLAFLSESLACRTTTLTAPALKAAARTLAALGKLAIAAPPGFESLRRPRFFAGRLLDAADLTTEQDYHHEKRRRHNRALFGAGIASGFEVGVEAAGDRDTASVVVGPGFGIDPYGEEVSLPCTARLPLPQDTDHALVTLRYWERASSPVPSADGGSAMSMIEEGCTIGIVAEADPNALLLARLNRVEERWVLDPAYAPPRIGSAAETTRTGALKHPRRKPLRARKAR